MTVHATILVYLPPNMSFSSFIRKFIHTEYDTYTYTTLGLWGKLWGKFFDLRKKIIKKERNYVEESRTCHDIIYPQTGLSIY